MTEIDPFDAAIAEAYASAPVDRIIWATLELNHPAFTAPVRLIVEHGEALYEDADTAQPVYGRMLRVEEDAVHNPGELVSFLSIAITLVLPASDDQAPEMTIAASNVGGVLMDAINAAVDDPAPVETIYREYDATDPDTVHRRLDGLSIRRVTATMLRVDAKAGFLDLDNQSVPNEYFTSESNPSLAR